jgi:fucose permease
MYVFTIIGLLLCVSDAFFLSLFPGICFAGVFGIGLACMRAPLLTYARSGRNFAILTGALLMVPALMVVHDPVESPATAYALLALVPLSLLWAWRRARREEKRRAAEAQRQAAEQ